LGYSLEIVKSQRSKAESIRHPTLFPMAKLEDSATFPNTFQVDRPYSVPGILLGTSAFTANGWEGSFYPKGMRSTDYLAFYAERFQTVEIDSTFYGCPSARTVSNWGARTPDDFIFSVKVPQVITHDKALVDCDAEFEEFVKTMDILGPKLGPIVFQFPSFDKWTFPKQDSFLTVLVPFLKKLPADHNFVVEIRNKNWQLRAVVGLLRHRHSHNQSVRRIRGYLRVVAEHESLIRMLHHPRLRIAGAYPGLPLGLFSALACLPLL
jgi:uncharacterized protein YecE (DUF72 family)